MASMGFREVGIYEKHARLDGQWRDVVIVERLIPENVQLNETIRSTNHLARRHRGGPGAVRGDDARHRSDGDADRGAQPRRRAAAGAAAEHRLAPAARGRLVRLLPAREPPELLAHLPGAAGRRRRRLLHDSRRRERAAARRAADGPRLAGRQRGGIGARAHRHGHHERRRRRHLRGVRGVVRHAAGRLAGRVPRHRDHRRRRAVPVVPLPDAHRPLLRSDRRADLPAHAVALGRRPHRPRDQRRRRSVPEAGAHRLAPAADARAAQHRVLLADGARSLPRVLGDRPADLALGRHHRRDLHAIGERRRRRDPRQPRRARSVERRGRQGARPCRRRHARAVPPVPQPAVRDAGAGALSARQRHSSPRRLRRTPT